MPHNPYYDYTTEGKEVSSTLGARHLTFLESEITHPSHPADGWVDGKDPVLVGENIVGVAFTSASSNNDLIAIDTEGIWALLVYASDELGPNPVAIGDEIFINKTTCLLSKNFNKNTHQHFGYALKAIDTTAEVIPVKVHWDPDDAMEMVGAGAVFFSSAYTGEFNFRQYRYRTVATSGDVRGEYMALALNGAGGSGEAMRGRTIVEAVGVLVAHGGHFGVEYDADGTLTGLGAGVRGTLMGPNRALGGTIAGGMSELWAEGVSTNFRAAIHSIHRFVMDGDATGRATADNVWEFANLTATQYVSATPTCNQLLRVIINGATKYVMISDDTT